MLYEAVVSFFVLSLTSHFNPLRSQREEVDTRRIITTVAGSVCGFATLAVRCVQYRHVTGSVFFGFLVLSLRSGVCAKIHFACLESPPHP